MIKILIGQEWGVGKVTLTVLFEKQDSGMYRMRDTGRSIVLYRAKNELLDLKRMWKV